MGRQPIIGLIFSLAYRAIISCCCLAGSSLCLAFSFSTSGEIFLILAMLS